MTAGATRPAQPEVLWVRRAPSDHPFAALAAELPPGISVRFLDWDEAPDGSKRSRALQLAKLPGREPIAITLPRWSAIRSLLTAPERSVIVNAQGIVCFLATLGRLRRPRRKVISLIEHHPQFGGPSIHVWWKRPIRRLFTVGVHRFVANTTSGAQWLIDGLGVSPARVGTGWYMAGLPEARLPRTIHPGGPLRLAFVGSLNPRKQPMVAVDLVAELATRGITATLTIYGRGQQHDELARRIASDGLGERVRLAGFVDRDDLAASFAEHDLLLVPSGEDLMPRVACEAMSCGLPVMAGTMIGAAHALIDDGVNGLVMSSVDAELWAERLAGLSSDDWARLVAGASARGTGLTSARCVEPIHAALVAVG